MSSERDRRRRAHLMAEDPHCRNCGVEVVHFRPGQGEILPDNFATLEHLNSRNQSLPRPRWGRKTLWCLRCNLERGAAEVAALDPAEHLRRIGRRKREPGVRS